MPMDINEVLLYTNGPMDTCVVILHPNGHALGSTIRHWTRVRFYCTSFYTSEVLPNSGLHTLNMLIYQAGHERGSTLRNSTLVEVLLRSLEYEPRFGPKCDNIISQVCLRFCESSGLGSH